jgi:signal recognition particle subunit SRP19
LAGEKTAKNNEQAVIWAAYFDANISRENGRRVPKKLALPAPDIDKIYAIAKSLNLNPVLEKDKRYPSRWWESRGRVIVDKRQSKGDIIKIIAKRLKT